MQFDLATTNSSMFRNMELEELKRASREYTEAILDPATPRSLRIKYLTRRGLAESMLIKRMHTSANQEDENQ
jgi:hypothetical protein